MEYRVERLSDQNAAEWDEFNRKSDQGSFFHSLKWKSIAEKDPNYKPHYYLLLKDDAVAGIFPFVEGEIRHFRGLVPSTFPHRLHGILDDDSDPDGIECIITELKRSHQFTNRLSFVRFSLLHHHLIDNIKKYPVFPLANEGDLILDLSEYPPEAIWRSFSAKRGQRKFIRRFDENGYRAVEVQSHDELRLFYQYYMENIAFIGGTLRPLSHFIDLWENLAPDEMRVTLLTNDSTVAGGLFMTLDKARKAAFLNYLSLNRNLPNTYHPSYYLWWEAINWAWKSHFEKVSFGAQHLDENNPRYRIKSEFNAKFHPTYSRMIPLTTMFKMGITLKRTTDGLPKGPRSFS